MVMKSLTKAQKDKLKIHSVHHSYKHMAKMRAMMMNGRSFTEAHKEAMKSVGK